MMTSSILFYILGKVKKILHKKRGLLWKTKKLTRSAS